MIIICITIFFFVVYTSLIIYYRQSWLQIPKTNYLQQALVTGFQTNISVIIPARNEEDTIGECLQSVISQNYPRHLFELIVIDDFSTDNTAAVIASFTGQNVSMIALKDFIGSKKINSYKKKAIEIAIAKAKGDLIVTTDADCIVPSTWLQAISVFYEKYSPAFIVAPVVYSFPAAGETKPWIRFLKIFQSLDFMCLQGITGAAVYKQFHSMCNGANMAYQKKAFYEVEGFKGIDNIASGDDMLLMHKIHKKYPGKVLFLKAREAVVKTKPMETFMDLYNQRIRWASKADRYPDKKIMSVLIMIYLFNFWIFLLAIFSFFFHNIFYWFLGLLISKTIVELFFLYPVAKFFKKIEMLWWFPLAQPFHILYTIAVGTLAKSGSYKWKERKVK